MERQRLSFLHMLRDTLLEKLRRSRSFGDLASLRPRPKSSLEVYVSVMCPSKPDSCVRSHLRAMIGVESNGGHTLVLCELRNATTCVCMLPLHDVHRLLCFSSPG